MNEPLEGDLIRNSEGRYVQGASGNKVGRPKGSKNKVTLYKLQIEESFRSRNQERINDVLDMIVQQALEGDKASQKLIWDANVSKAQVAEDKSAGQKQQITVHRMTVTRDQSTNEESKDE